MSEQLQVLKQINRTYRNYEFLSVHVSDLSESVRQRLEKDTPAMLALDFRELGDFRQKPQPVEVHARYFVSRDGRTFADICAVLDSGGISFVSVLDNGLCVHTTSVANPHPERQLTPEDQMWIVYLPGVTVAQQYHHHENTVRQLSDGTGSKVLQFKPDQFRAVFVYDQRIFCRWRYRHGGLDKMPPAPDFETLQATSGASLDPNSAE